MSCLARSVQRAKDVPTATFTATDPPHSERCWLASPYGFLFTAQTRGAISLVHGTSGDASLCV
jgi:hypothetical protein